MKNIDVLREEIIITAQALNQKVNIETMPLKTSVSIKKLKFFTDLSFNIGEKFTEFLTIEDKTVLSSVGIITAVNEKIVRKNTMDRLFEHVEFISKVFASLENANKMAGKNLGLNALGASLNEIPDDTYSFNQHQTLLYLRDILCTLKMYPKVLIVPQKVSLLQKMICDYISIILEEYRLYIHNSITVSLIKLPENISEYLIGDSDKLKTAVDRVYGIIFERLDYLSKDLNSIIDIIYSVVCDMIKEIEESDGK